MSDIVCAIAARHAEDEADGPFVGRRSEQSRLDREALLAEIAKLREERLFDFVQVVMERDAAIRERDALRVERITQALTADRFAAAVAEADTLRAQVAFLEEQLESVSRRAATAETDVQDWIDYVGRGPGLSVSHWQPLPPGPEANG